MLESLLNGVRRVAVVCNQWGDTGKGKIVDALAEWADVTGRGTGGNNAGHTYFYDGKERVQHLIPVGIVHDAEGKITIIGNGTVIDIGVLCVELDELARDGLSYNHLMISSNAHVIMPYHIELDRQKNKSLHDGGIGSTGRGIGPCYTDKIARRGIMIKDLYDRDVLAQKIKTAAPYYPGLVINAEEIIEGLQVTAQRIKPLVKDTVLEMHNLMRSGKRIVFEGAQGLLLSIEHGTYPYVTSSDCSVNGTATGLGVSARDIDLVLGLVKFPFMTRVGGGPFVTEIGGTAGEEYCREESRTKESELRTYEILFHKDGKRITYDMHHSRIVAMMNSADKVVRAAGIRLAAGEFGATTGRLRRIGWTDAVAAKYAVGINGARMVLTKVDSAAEMDSFSLCYGYRTPTGESQKNFTRDSDTLRQLQPELKQYARYGHVRDIRDYHGLPSSLQQAVMDFEQFTEGVVNVISTGPEKEHTIVRRA